MGWLTGGGFSLHSLSGAHEPRSGTLFPGGEYCRRRTKRRKPTVSLFFSIFYDISNELRSTDFP